VRPTSPETLGVYVEPVSYTYRDTRSTYGGGGFDLTSEIPGTANHQRYVLITLDIVEGRIRQIRGPSSPNTVPPTPPRVPLWNVPLAGAILYNGMTVVAEADIAEFRVQFLPTGSPQTYRNLTQWMDYQENQWTRHLQGEL
jgi:hypothetical protein